MIKRILTGSNEKKEEIDSETEDRVNEIFDELLSTIFQYESEKLMYNLHPPEENFSLHWFINLQSKMIESFPKGVHVEVLEDYDDDSYICFALGKQIIVKKDLLKDRISN